ncbi:hypothetical protein [Kitasatospora cheerisanensis]|uniref:Cupin n=1 Tax=Kitasatospora cheerisanensis KCTC 2395 TaxID=1348663 RepID=A0A066YRM1_9ACTN|nr:hypothetical protein [Kitasatospora cheerisanensis]KDN80585.1 hypothetical protein KCH_76340 [Kitasatospora cheerisanensis KCTC 2395]
MHLAAGELYLPLTGRGAAQFLTPAGPQQIELRAGCPVQFTPGTLHRLITTDDRLELLVLMENGRLNEEGDVVFTFPPENLADPQAYFRLAEATDESAVLRRRDRAVEGFTLLNRLWQDDPEAGRRALATFYAAAVALIQPRAAGWTDVFAKGPGFALRTMADRISALADGESAHLAEAAVTALAPFDENNLTPRACGWLWSYHAP